MHMQVVHYTAANLTIWSGRPAWADMLDEVCYRLPSLFFIRKTMCSHFSPTSIVRLEQLSSDDLVRCIEYIRTCFLMVCDAWFLHGKRHNANNVSIHRCQAMYTFVKSSASGNLYIVHHSNSESSDGRR